MDTQEIARINSERLGGWQRVLVDRHATAAILIAIGHDHARGELQLCTTEDTPLPVIRGWLAWMIAKIDDGNYEEEHGNGSPQSGNGTVL